MLHVYQWQRIPQVGYSNSVFVFVSHSVFLNMFNVFVSKKKSNKKSAARILLSSVELYFYTYSELNFVNSRTNG